MTTRTDFLLMEVGGKAVSVTVKVVTPDHGVIGSRTYELAGYAQQVVNLSAILATIREPTVHVTVSGPGRVVPLKPTADKTLHGIAVRAEAPASPTGSRTNLLIGFKASPFVEPATGLVSMRDRWYDPSSGAFLTPDRERYGDSSNVYSFCRNDPVNCSDPTGRSATVAGGLLGAIGGSGYTIYRSVRHGDPFTWNYIAQGTASGAAIGFGIDTLGAGSGVSASILGGVTIGGGAGGAFSTVQSGGDWRAYGRGTLKGAALGGLAGATGYGIGAAGLGGGWSFAGSVAAPGQSPAPGRDGDSRRT